MSLKNILQDNQNDLFCRDMTVSRNLNAHIPSGSLNPGAAGQYLRTNNLGTATVWEDLTLDSIPSGALGQTQYLTSTALGVIEWEDIPAGGSVTNVAVTPNNGITSSVANPTTAATITLGLNNITPNSVAAVGTVTGSNLSGTNTGDQTITLTSDVTGSGTGSFATTIANNAVTYPKMQVMGATPALLGSAAGSTVPGEITLGTNLSFAGSVLNATGGSGTVTNVSVVTANGFSGTVANPTTTPSITLSLGSGAVSYSNIQNVTAARLLGNPTGIAGAPSEISLGTNLSFAGSVLNATGGSTYNPLYGSVITPAGPYTTGTNNAMTITIPANTFSSSTTGTGMRYLAGGVLTNSGSAGTAQFKTRLQGNNNNMNPTALQGSTWNNAAGTCNFFYEICFIHTSYVSPGNNTFKWAATFTIASAAALTPTYTVTTTGTETSIAVNANIDVESQIVVSGGPSITYNFAKLIKE